MNTNNPFVERPQELRQVRLAQDAGVADGVYTLHNSVKAFRVQVKQGVAHFALTALGLSLSGNPATDPKPITVLKRVPVRADQWELAQTLFGPKNTRYLVPDEVLAHCNGSLKPDPLYVWPEGIASSLASVLLLTQSALVVGPHGTGKSELFAQLALMLNLPLFEVECSEGTTKADLVGSLRIHPERGTYFQPGPVALALQHGGILLLNEIDRVAPNQSSFLQDLLTKGQVVVPEDVEMSAHGLALPRLIRAGKQTHLVLTSNAWGRMSHLRRNYPGGQPQRATIMDRVPVVVEMGYMPAESEKELGFTQFLAMLKNLNGLNVKPQTEKETIYLEARARDVSATAALFERPIQALYDIVDGMRGSFMGLTATTGVKYATAFSTRAMREFMKALALRLTAINRKEYQEKVVAGRTVKVAVRMQQLLPETVAACLIAGLSQHEGTAFLNEVVLKCTLPDAECIIGE